MTLTIPPDVPNTAQPSPQLIHVLFADDSSAMRTLARYSLTAGKGFSVAEARDGAEALAMFDAQRPDCVVLDIEMPRVGGFEALDELQRRCPEMPVVMLSGFSDPALTNKARDRGAVAYLEKSSEMGRLAETVRRVSTGSDPETSQPSLAAPPTAARAADSVVEPAVAAPQDAERTDDSTAAADLRRLEYVISHDFAEPVRIMGGFASLLDKRYASALDASGQAFLAHLLEGAQRMQLMVDDLLVYSRAGRASARPELLDLAQLVTEVAAEVAPPTAEPRVESTVGDLPPVWADASMLKTVLRQVVVNGLTFNTSAVPAVQIAGRVVGPFCVLTVTDNGIGVGPAQTDAVFELFRRLNTREEFAGTGTGLALCRRLLTLQSGTITLTSAAAGGTVVTITLPARAPSDPDPRRQA